MNYDEFDLMSQLKIIVESLLKQNVDAVKLQTEIKKSLEEMVWIFFTVSSGNNAILDFTNFKKHSETHGLEQALFQLN